MLGLIERIERDVAGIQNDRSLVRSGIRLERDENDIRHFIGSINGPVSTPYENGVFKIDIDLTDGFPFKAPVVRFITKIWHLNISSQNGETRLNILEDWSPTTSIKTILIALQTLLAIPDRSLPLDAEVANQYFKYINIFNSKAQTWTMEYAVEHLDPPPQPSTRTRTSGRRRVARNPVHLNNYVL